MTLKSVFEGKNYLIFIIGKFKKYLIPQTHPSTLSDIPCTASIKINNRTKIHKKKSN